MGGHQWKEPSPPFDPDAEYSCEDCTRASKLIKKHNKLLDSANEVMNEKETLKKENSQLKTTVTSLQKMVDTFEKQNAAKETPAWRKGEQEQDPAVMLKALSFAASAEHQGKIYIVGGKDEYNVLSDSVLEYDTVANSWKTLPGHMKTPRSGHASCLVGDSTYTIGGWVGSGTLLATIERLDLACADWVSCTSLIGAPRWRHA
eukprot:TRINITY_DN1436_c0_g1_i1.p1 TRINITY_DN1436_c0_g1~~TRINITY_DN1436_c0_g1_i1.p1  ORF type:complete len:220 (+),score=41.82 TRINITY_DN1436_c0_g1_i1:54-662(+)